RAQITTSVPTAERHTGNEVVQNEIVQNDDAGTTAESLDNPSVRRRVVANVVEIDVRFPVKPARALKPTRTASDDVDVDSPRQCRQEQGAVIRDTRPIGRKGRVIGDPHANKRSIAALQVSRWATRCPARPQALVSSGWARNQAKAPASAAPVGSQT